MSIIELCTEDKIAKAFEFTTVSLNNIKEIEVKL